MGRLLRKKTIMIIIVAVVIIGGGLAGAIIYFQLQLKAQQSTAVTVNKPVVAQTVCSDAILTQAAAAMAYPTDPTKLPAIANTIMAMPQYTSDVNCLYVVLQYNLAFSQATDARTNINSIKGLYKSAIGYNQIIKTNASPPEVLEKMVANLEATTAKFIKSDPITGLNNEPAN